MQQLQKDYIVKQEFGNGDGSNMFDINKHEIKLCSINEFNGILKALNGRKFVFENAKGKDVGPRVYFWATDKCKAYLSYNEYTDKIIT